MSLKIVNFSATSERGGFAVMEDGSMWRMEGLKGTPSMTQVYDPNAEDDAADNPQGLSPVDKAKAEAGLAVESNNGGSQEGAEASGGQAGKEEETAGSKEKDDAGSQGAKANDKGKSQAES